jgi:hypothetical protein
MGLLQQIQSGAQFVRGTTTLSVGSGSSTTFGSTYILLDITTTGAGRTRLYSDSASVNIDDPRPTASFSYSASVGLSLDTVYESASKIIFDPPIIASTFSASQTWYNVSGSSVTLTYYPIESSYTTRNRLDVYSVSLPAGTRDFGNITSPKSFIILSASCSSSESRLRLYSRDINLVPTSETTRAFTTAPSENSYIIADMIFDTASYAYILSPVLQAFNLEQYTQGGNYVGYIIDNISTTGTISDVTASLHIYPIED